MPTPKLNTTYLCSHSYSHPNLGRMLRKGKRYKCTEISERGTISMEGMYHDGVNCDIKFFEEHFVELDQADTLNTKTLTLTTAETVWLKNFFKKHIDEIADLDGGVDYKSLMTVSDKIEKM